MHTSFLTGCGCGFWFSYTREMSTDSQPLIFIAKKTDKVIGTYYFHVTAIVCVVRLFFQVT